MPLLAEVSARAQMYERHWAQALLCCSSIAHVTPGSSALLSSISSQEHLIVATHKRSDTQWQALAAHLAQHRTLQSRAVLSQLPQLAKLCCKAALMFREAALVLVLEALVLLPLV